jgi:hypothetical protein
MADSINRIGPSTIAPERYPVSRRERDERSKKEPQQKDGDKPKAFPVFPVTEPLDAGDEIAESSKDKIKGKILDIDA